MSSPLSRHSLRNAFVMPAAMLLSCSPALAQAGAPTPVQGYTLSVFATGVPGKYTRPDSIAVYQDHVYIAYGDGNDPTGNDGKTNMVVEYTRSARRSTASPSKATTMA